LRFGLGSLLGGELWLMALLAVVPPVHLFPVHHPPHRAPALLFGDLHFHWPSLRRGSRRRIRMAAVFPTVKWPDSHLAPALGAPPTRRASSRCVCRSRLRPCRTSLPVTPRGYS